MRWLMRSRSRQYGRCYNDDTTILEAHITDTSLTNAQLAQQILLWIRRHRQEIRGDSKIDIALRCSLLITEIETFCKEQLAGKEGEINKLNNIAGPCPFCPDGHDNPNRHIWTVTIGDKLDHDGQPTQLTVMKNGYQHVAKSDADWLWKLIRDAKGQQ